MSPLFIPRDTKYPLFTALLEDIKKDFPGKPLLAVAQPGDREIYREMRRGFQAIGIPCYPGDDDAVFALAAMWRYQAYLIKSGS